MKSWRDVPYLFANGKFKIQCEWTSQDGKEHVFMDHIYGFSIDEGHGAFIVEDDETGKHTDLIYLSECTLIARRISDMSDEECKLIDPMWEGSEKILKASLISESRNGILRQHRLLTLLSIGVYPFDQSHFDSGEVIDAKEGRKITPKKL